MTKTIYSLIKIFKKESHREDFLKGNLYMNRMKYFKRIEDKEENNRSDIDEGVSGWYQPNKNVFLKINENIIPSEDLDGPIKIEYDKHIEVNIFCLSALYHGDFNQSKEEDLIQYQKDLKLHNKMVELGDYCVIIINPWQFIGRVKSTIQQKNLKGWLGLVEYFDPNIFHGKFQGIEPFFRKQKQYSYQKEYRIVLQTEIKGDNPYVLNIGSIQDICLSCRTDKVNSLIDIKMQ